MLVAPSASTKRRSEVNVGGSGESTRELDDLSARRIKRHLRACRRCGLELDVCAEIKQFLADRGESPDPAALDRLRAFGQELVEHGPPGPASA